MLRYSVFAVTISKGCPHGINIHFNAKEGYNRICDENNFKETCDIKSQVDDEQLSSTKPRRTDGKDLKSGGFINFGDMI